MTIPAMLLLVVPPAVVVERGSVNGRRGTGSALRLELDRLVGQRGCGLLRCGLRTDADLLDVPSPAMM